MSSAEINSASSPLANEQAFRAFIEQIEQRIEQQRNARLNFLAWAKAQAEPLLVAAETLGIQAVAAEILDVLDALAREREQLLAIPAASRDDPPAPPIQLHPTTEEVEAPDIPSELSDLWYEEPAAVTAVVQMNAAPSLQAPKAAEISLEETTVPLPEVGAEPSFEVPEFDPEAVAKQAMATFSPALVAPQYAGEKVSQEWMCKVRAAAAICRAVHCVGTPTPLAKQFANKVAHVRAEAGHSGIFDERLHLHQTDWRELPPLWEAAADAFLALRWVREADPAVKTALPLLESIGAVYQRLYRKMTSLGLTDDLLQKLLDKLVGWRESHDAPEITTLAHNANPVRLEKAACALAKHLEEAKVLHTEWLEQSNKKERRETAIANAIDFLRQNEHFDDPETASELFTRLRECKDAGVPPSHKEIRDLLLPHVAVLKQESNLKLIATAVQTEIERLASLEGPSEEDDRPEYSVPTNILEAVQKVTRGKKAVMFGGVNRPEACERIVNALELEALEWPEIRRADRVEEHVHGNDIVIVLVSLSRSAHTSPWMSDIVKDDGAVLVKVPHGYGLSRIVHAAFDQITPEGKAAQAAAAKKKPVKAKTSKRA